MTSPNAIEIHALAKHYGKVEALRGLDLRVPQGSLAGLVGLNGAGKTTTLRLLLGLARPSAGHASIFGLSCHSESDSVRIRRRTAALPEQKALFPYMTVAQILQFTRGFYPHWRDALAQRLLADFELDPKRKPCSLSKGQLTKLHLVLCLARGADLLLLDEPTDGLDPVATEIALQAMVSLVAESGATILLCSHRLNEIEQVADHLCFIHKGRALLDESLDDLKARARRLVLVFDQPNPAAEAALARHGRFRRDGRSVSLTLFSQNDEVEAEARSFGAVSVQSTPLNLHDLFLEMVKS